MDETKVYITGWICSLLAFGALMAGVYGTISAGHEARTDRRIAEVEGCQAVADNVNDYALCLNLGVDG